MEKNLNKREYWIDFVKCFACVLVVLGHFYQSMVASNVLVNNFLYKCFNNTIYYFHVPLFFICSGYLYQRFCKVNSIKSWCNNSLKKLILLGIPYIIFSIITWVLKIIFSDSVNIQVEGLLYCLFVKPISPYWYLYALFFIFLITPTFTKKLTLTIVLFSASLLKIFTFFEIIDCYAVNIIIQNWIWFVFGAVICYFDIFSRLKNKFCFWIGIIVFVLFISVSIIVNYFNISGEALSFVLGIVGCCSTLTVANKIDYSTCFEKILKRCSYYFLPIFLMHTIFAAALRSLLFKIGIFFPIIHISGGIIISFVGPIVAMFFISKIKWLEFLIYPSKYLKKENNE